MFYTLIKHGFLTNQRAGDYLYFNKQLLYEVEHDIMNIKTEVCVICRSRKSRQMTQTRGFDNS